jgi:hypothetical protein
MPNGNTLITIFGVPPLFEINIIEIDNGGILQWEYLGNFITFRASKYPLSYFNNNIQSGDLNGDGILNVLDVVVLINIILGNTEPFGTGDLNEDGQINILDVVQLINIILTL